MACRACFWWGSRLVEPNLRRKSCLYSTLKVENRRWSSGWIFQGGGVQVDFTFSLVL